MAKKDCRREGLIQMYVIVMLYWQGKTDAKKVYLETIEKELQVARKANFALAKELKRQLEIAQRLEEEISNHEEDNVYKKINFGKSSRVLNSSRGGDLQCTQFFSPTEGSVTFPLEDYLHYNLSLDFSTSNFFTDYNADNLVSTNLSIVPISDDMSYFTNEPCEATSDNKNPDQKSDCIDVVGDYSFLGKPCINSNWGTACRTPLLQLLSE